MIPLLVFRKKSSRLSAAGPEILALSSHLSMNFQPILNCLIPNFKLKYENSENVKRDHVNTVAFNLHQMERRNFLGTPGRENLSINPFTNFSSQSV